MRTRTAVAGLLALTMASAGCATRTAGIPTAADEPHVTQVATTTEPKPQAKPEGHGGLRPDVIVGSTKKQQGLRIALTFDEIARLARSMMPMAGSVTPWARGAMRSRIGARQPAC